MAQPQGFVWTDPEALPISLSPWKQQEASGISQGVLWCVFLYEAMEKGDHRRRQGEPTPPCCPLAAGL